MLRSCSTSLSTTYDVAVLDLDGVVYIGRDAVPGAGEALRQAARDGMHLAFVTNSAARTPADVGAHLRELGIDAVDGDVVTSAQAAAHLVADLVPAGSAVYVIGGEGLEVALVERGLRPVVDPVDDVAAVVQGYGPTMPWRQVVNGAILVARGLPWVASNLDLTIPTSLGRGPGNGALVHLVAEFSGRTPVVAGKPQRPLFEETLLRVGGSHPLVIGDRLDTDIEGAMAMGWDSLLVMTGVTDLQVLVGAERRVRPSYVSAGLSGLFGPVEAPRVTDSGTVCRGWTAGVVKGRLRIGGAGDLDDWWRVAAAVAWAHLDVTGEPVVVDPATTPGSVVP